MGAWSRIREFFDRSESIHAPMDDPFIQLDRDAAAEALRLRERGAEQGLLDLPATSTSTPDVAEAEVEAFILDHFRRAQIDASNSIRSYDSRLTGLSLIANLGSIRTQAKVALGDFKAEVVNRGSRLANSRDAIVESYAELRQFKQEHGLRRPAHEAPPSSATVGTILVCWLLETIANSMFLRLGDSMGWLGGVIAAAVVGAINVGFAAFVGRLVWPMTNHRSAAARLVGWTAIAAWIAATLIWNLLAGHYRDAKSLGLPSPETAALGMLGSSLDSIYSYGLLIAGLVFAIGAAISGYKMDDPYPGYGPVARRHTKRCEDYVTDVEEATAELIAIRNYALEEATEVRLELGRQHRERQQILTYREAFRRRFEEHAVYLETTGNVLLQEYRTANRAARSTEPPERFDVAWKMPRAPLPPPPGEDVSPSAIDAAEKDLEQAINEISKAFDEAVDSFEPLDELKRRIADG